LSISECPGERSASPAVQVSSSFEDLARRFFPVHGFIRRYGPDSEVSRWVRAVEFGLKLESAPGEPHGFSGTNRLLSIVRRAGAFDAIAGIHVLGVEKAVP